MDLPGHSRIPSRNRRQTMDWGLVLISQGIAATIDDGADGAGWCLWVSDPEYPAALEAIRLYELENRRWHWRQPLPWRGFLFDWKILFWALLLVVVFAAQTAQPDFTAAGCMNNAAVRSGQWWRLFTAILLHADVAHLVSNVALGVVLLGLAMGRYGSGLGLLAAYLAGAAGNFAGLLVYPPAHLGLGASGMVMGALGLLAAQSLNLLAHGPVARKFVLRALFAGVMLFALFGLSPETDVVAHFTGFVTGLALGGLVVVLPPAWQNRITDTLAALLFVVLLLTTASLAFR